MLRIAALAALMLAPCVLATPVAARTITVETGANAQERLQSALIEAAPGDVVQIGAGRFELTDGLSLDVDKVTVRGAGSDKTVLSFKGQIGAGEGLLVTSDDVVLRDFAVWDTRGDGIKSKGADRIVYKNIHVQWSGGPKETNGAYGIYPVESKFVLIDGVSVSGASDAGIYVGQSEQIVVRHSTVMNNVAGIEIENSRFAEVHHNYAAHNTGGILVFDLPNLPKEGGGDVLVRDNRVIDNDQPNFAPKGNIVASVRKGTGVLIMANEKVRVTGNELSGNATSNIMIISYRQPFTDPHYNPLPRWIMIGNNRYGPAGFAPQLPGGDLLAAAFGGSIPPILWDGSGDPKQISNNDDAKALSLGLAPGAPVETAKPVPVTFAAAPIWASMDVILPPEMEAAAR